MLSHSYAGWRLVSNAMEPNRKSIEPNPPAGPRVPSRPTGGDGMAARNQAWARQLRSGMYLESSPVRRARHEA